MTLYNIKESDIEKGIIGKNKDVKEGIGTIELLIQFSSFVDSEHPLSFEVKSSNLFTDNGKQVCKMCGYDRGIVHKHTEVMGYSVECENCGKTVYKVEN